MTKIQAVTPSFWTGTIENWDTSVWTLEQGKLPTLFGEDGEPGLSLTGLPTDDLTITPDSTTLTRSASPQPVDFSVTGMEDWTHPLIEWSATAGGSIESTVNGEATLTVDANYAGVITVTAENKNSGRTAIATVTVITVPGAPTNVTATPGNGQVTLSWSAPDDTGGAAVIRYEVAGNLVVWASVPSSETSYTFTGLTNGTEYTFKVRAVNAVGNGPEAAVTATPGASAIVVTGVTLDLYTLTLLAQGDTQALTATVLPANATNQAVTWQSSDTAVATVDASGVVAGIAEGTATVTATTVDGGFTAACAVTVLPEDTVIVPVTGVSVSPASVSIKPGGTRQLTATVSPADATFRDISWRSSDLTVATVDGYGKVTTVALGRATITATTRDGGFTATCAVTVTYETGGYTTGDSDSGDRDKTGIDYIVQQGIYWIEQAEAKTLAGSAREKGESLVRTRRSASTGIRKAALEALAGLKYEHDTVAGSAVQVRVSIPEPGKAASDLMVSGHVKGSGVDYARNTFETWFANAVRAIHMDQAEPWGRPVDIAARIDLTGMDIQNLYFYSYDKKTNTYKRIEKPAYWIDKNGYLRFTTELAGDIIISEGPLERK